MDPSRTSRRLRVSLQWVAGFVVATLGIWAVGAVALSDVFIWQHDDVTGRWLPKPNLPYTYTREGWGTTTWQPHGRLAETLPGKDEPTVVFWGDSYVEALQMDSHEKMFNVFTQLAAERGSNLRGIGVALSGWDLADYHDLLPKLRGHLGKPVRHVFVVHINDVLPNGSSEKTLRDDETIFYPAPHQPGWQSIRPTIYHWELSAFWLIPRDGALALRNLRLKPGPVKTSMSPSTPPRDRKVSTQPSAAMQDQLAAFWARAIAALQERADAPIAFVLMPRCPQIRDGKVDTQPTAHELFYWDAFLAACQANGVDCIDMTQPFNDFFYKDRHAGRFPRGFANTIPSEGHLNADGNALVATAVADWLLGEAQESPSRTRTDSETNSVKPQTYAFREVSDLRFRPEGSTVFSRGRKPPVTDWACDEPRRGDSPVEANKRLTTREQEAD